MPPQSRRGAFRSGCPAEIEPTLHDPPTPSSRTEPIPGGRRRPISPRAWTAGTDCTVSRWSPLRCSKRLRGARPWLSNPQAGQTALRVRRRDDGDTAVQGPACHAVEVVAVQVREDHEIQTRQVLGQHRRLGDAARPQALPAVRALTPVEEVGGGEDLEGPEPQERRRRADEGEAVHSVSPPVVSASVPVCPAPRLRTDSCAARLRTTYVGTRRNETGSVARDEHGGGAGRRGRLVRPVRGGCGPTRLGAQDRL